MLRFVKRHCRAVGAAVFAVTAAAVLCCGVCSVDACIAVRVRYNGKKIATVRSAADFESAVQVVTQTVAGSAGDVAAIVKQPVFDTVLVNDSLIDDRETVVQAILDNTADIVHGFTLTVDGEAVACVENPDLALWVEQRRTAFDTDEFCTSAFVHTVSVEEGYYLAREMNTDLQAHAAVAALAVQTVRTLVQQQEIAYQTVQKCSTELAIGQENLLVAGENGISQTTETTVYLNGTLSVPTVTQTETVREAVNEIVEIGTVVKTSDESVGNAGFIFPLPANVWTVSAYYGDGRNHRAIDLACDYGTPIYAVADGTVTEACWDGQYGYCVIVDHGNGVQTRYAHASAMNVVVGDKVSAGDKIAAVGATGLATGNHLHFEVIINGSEVNPAPYIGL